MLSNQENAVVQASLEPQTQQQLHIMEITELFKYKQMAFLQFSSCTPATKQNHQKLKKFLPLILCPFIFSAGN